MTILYRSGISAALFCAVSFGAISLAQAQSTGPLFSTPASRSTTGAPILSNPSADPDGIIPSTEGAGAPAPRSKTAAAPAKPAGKEAAKPAAAGWAVSCETVSAKRMCQISASAITGDASQVILVLSLAPSAKGIAMQMAVPLGIAVQKKVQLTIADAYKTELVVDRCTQQGCLIDGEVEPRMLDAMKAKPTLQVVVTTPEGNGVPIDLSLDGFGKALEDMQKQTASTQ